MFCQKSQVHACIYPHVQRTGVTIKQTGQSWQVQLDNNHEPVSIAGDMLHATMQATAQAEAMAAAGQADGLAAAGHADEVAAATAPTAQPAYPKVST